MTIREGAYIDHGKKNDEPHDQSVAGWGKYRGRGVDGCRIFAFRHVWRPKKGETSELSWQGGGTTGSFQGPLKLFRLVTQHWLQV